jgi:hypothetical protein
MNVGKVARIGAENGGSKVMLQRRLDAFDLTSIDGREPDLKNLNSPSSG